jgi:outer membrane receptor protein involved in Fe transport
MRAKLMRQSALGVLSLLSCAAAAQDSAQKAGPIDEIMVTATRHSESVANVPISIDALSEAALLEGGLKTIADIGSVSPGFQYAEPQNIPSTIQTLSVRGINSSTGQSPVGVYYGDTPLQIKLSGPTNFGTPMPIAFDLNRVEVERGPQGTLFGAGAEAGAVVLVPNEPGLAGGPTGYAHAEGGLIEGGSQDYEAQGAVEMPIAPGLAAFRLAAYQRHDGGYVDRVDPVTLRRVASNANTKDSTALRAIGVFKIGETVEVTPGMLVQILHRGDGGRFYDLFSSASNGAFAVGEFANGRLIPEHSTDAMYLPTLKIKAELPFADLTFNSSYIERFGHVKLDQSSSPPAGCILFDPADGQNDGCSYGSRFGTLYPVSDQQLNYTVYGQKLHGETAELRLASKDADALITWVAGVFYDDLIQTDTESQYDRFVDPTGNQILSAVQTSSDKQFAEFANVDVHITPALTATAGVRISELTANLHEYNGNTIQNAGEPYYWTVPALKETPITPHFSLSYKIDPDNMVYGAMGKGFRIGGGNSAVPASCNVSNADIGTYKSDDLWSYEIGQKSKLFGGLLQLDSSAFHMVWSNTQQLNFLPCQFSYTFNGGQAEVNGFDLQAKAAVTPHFKLGVNLGYADAYFTQSVFASSGQQLIQSGDKVGPAPQVNAPWNMSLWADYTVNMANGDDLTLRGEYKYKSHNPGPFVTQVPTSPNYFPGIVADPEINIVNARVSYLHGNTELSLYVDNVLNSHPVLQTFQESNAPGNNFLLSNTIEPRSVGITADYRF